MFTVPRDFNEFYTMYPNWVRDWVRQKMRWSIDRAEEAVEENFTTTYQERVDDLTQTLLVHLMALPQDSKYREQGFTDPIQLFRLEGNSTKGKFFVYLNTVMENKLRTLWQHEQLDAIKVEYEEVTPESVVTDGEAEQQRRLLFQKCCEAVHQHRPDLVSTLYDLCTSSGNKRGRAPEEAHDIALNRARLKAFLSDYVAGHIRQKRDYPAKRTSWKRPVENVPVLRAHDYVHLLSKKDATKILAFVSKAGIAVPVSQ